MTKFAAYDNDTHVIWGIGETEEAAVQDATHWLGLNQECSEVRADILSGLSVDPCSDDVARDAMMCGGQIPWMWSGTLPRYMQTASEGQLEAAEAGE